MNKRIDTFVWKPKSYRAKWVESYEDVSKYDPLYKALLPSEKSKYNNVSRLYPRVVIAEAETEYVRYKHYYENLKQFGEIYSQDYDDGVKSKNFALDLPYHRISYLPPLSYKKRVFIALSNMFKNDLIKDAGIKKLGGKEIAQYKLVGFSSNAGTKIQSRILEFIEKHSVLHFSDPEQDTYKSWIWIICEMDYFRKLLYYFSDKKKNEHILEEELEGLTKPHSPSNYGFQVQPVESKESFKERLSAFFWERFTETLNRGHFQFPTQASGASERVTIDTKNFKQPKINIHCGALTWAYYELWKDITNVTRWKQCDYCTTVFPYKNKSGKFCSDSCKQQNFQRGKKVLG